MKTKFGGKSRMAVLLFLSGLLCLMAPKARGDEGDPPTRVARISYIDGTVSLQPGGDGDWAAAAKNRPMTIGDKMWVDKDSRAELQAGSVAVHLGSMTALSFLNLDENITQMRLAEGSINFRVREMREGETYEVDTPNSAFTVKEAGAFRIDVTETGDGTRITVIRGQGEVTAGGKTYAINAGERAEFNGSEADVQYNIDQASGPDGLDTWANQRDLKEDNSVSAQYVSRDMDGYSDLDDNGTWSEEPEYGHVWYPSSVPVGWAPYSDGYWNWVGPWGWTWVDYAPWGFAPFHYGRWNYFGGRWGWCPGPYYGRAFYGPAFVGFVGGANWGVGFGFGGGWGIGGGIGWFPLGWGECFHPWYRSGGTYIRNVNIHNTYIRNVNVINNNSFHNYMYAHNVNAVTATSRNGFVNGERVNRGAAHLTEANLRGAQISNHNALAPTRQSFTGQANAGRRVSTPSANIQNRAVVARTAPAPNASHMPVRTVNTAHLSAGRSAGTPLSGAGNRPVNTMNNRPTAGGSSERLNGGATIGHTNNAPSTPPASSRQHELSLNRPPSARNESNTSRAINGGMNPSGTRTWEAQGNQTDRGRAPSGFGSDRATGRPNGGTAQIARMNDNNRPPWARSGTEGNSSAQHTAPPSNNSSNHPSVNNNRGYTQQNERSYNNDRGGNRYSAPQRGNQQVQPRNYSAPPRSYSAPNRSYSAPSRSYPAPSRSYSAPSRSYSAPSRSYSAPSHSSGGGGGGGSHVGGGGGSHTRH